MLRMVELKFNSLKTNKRYQRKELIKIRGFKIEFAADQVRLGFFEIAFIKK